MDDYLEKFGFTPRDFGIDSFERPKQNYRHPSDKIATEVNLNMSIKKDDKNKFGNTKLDDLPLTMAYVPMQPLSQVYDEAQALKSGTLFPNLDKPFLGRKI